MQRRTSAAMAAETAHSVRGARLRRRATRLLALAPFSVAVVRWLSSAAAVLWFSSRKANLGKGIMLSSPPKLKDLLREQV